MVAGGLLHALVLEQAAHQLGARILGLGLVLALRARQQHARLDLDQQRGHQQVLGGELELGGAHHLDVAMYWRVRSAMGMSRMSSECLRMR